MQLSPTHANICSHSHTRSIAIVDVMSLVSNRPALFCVRLLTNVFPIVSASLTLFFPFPLFLPATLLLSWLPFAWYVTLITIFLTCVFAYMFYWAAIISASHSRTALTLHWGQLPWPDYMKILIFNCISIFTHMLQVMKSVASYIHSIFLAKDNMICTLLF